MADFTLSKSLFSGKYRNASQCLFNARKRLMQVQETGRPRVEIGLGVGTIFGLIPFLVGCLIFAVVALWLHWRHRRQ